MVAEESVEKAMQAVKRDDFLPEEVRAMAGMDMPLQIGHGQTNSQPTTVRLMLTWLEPKLGHTVLDVGSGSGWTSALLAKLVGSSGRVWAVERIPELVRFGEENAQRAGINNISFHQAGTEIGWPQDAPYDRILVSAAASELPEELIDQLKPGGRLVIPIKNSVFVIDNVKDGSTSMREIPGFQFVPLLH